MNNKTKIRLYKQANFLAIITIIYNVAEGMISMFFGIGDETAALFGFGLDSFAEVISGIGIWHMIGRLRKCEANANPDKFEQQALKVTGTAFYILTIGLLLTAAINIYYGHSPYTTIWGIVVSSVSILTMGILIHYKVKIGEKLGSQAILADAECTKTCLHLSLVLFLASTSYEITGIGYLDSIGAIIIAWFSFWEGREAFQKSKGINCCACK